MRGVAKRTEVGVVGRNDHHPAARSEQAMEFLDGANHIRDVLDDMRCADFAERIAFDRPWEMVEVSDNIRLSTRVAVDSDGAGVLINTAAYVQDWQGAQRTDLCLQGLEAVFERIHRIVRLFA